MTTVDEFPADCKLGNVSHTKLTPNAGSCGDLYFWQTSDQTIGSYRWKNLRGTALHNILTETFRVKIQDFQKDWLSLASLRAGLTVADYERYHRI